PKAETRDKLVFTSHAIVLLALAALRYVMQFSLFGFAEQHPRLLDIIHKLDIAAMGIVLLLALAKVGDVYLLSRIDSPVSRYNLRRVAKLMLGLLMIFILVLVVILCWYTTVAAISLFSILLV